MKIRFLGAAGDVTGSAYQVIIKDASILATRPTLDLATLDWYGVMAPSRPRTIITHGEDRARRAFSEKIKQRFGVQTECPALDDAIEI